MPKVKEQERFLVNAGGDYNCIRHIHFIVYTNYLHSLNLILRVLGTRLIVRDTRVFLFSMSPMAGLIARCRRLAMLLVTVSSIMESQMPWRYFLYMSSCKIRRLLGSRRRDKRYRESGLLS